MESNLRSPYGIGGRESRVRGEEGRKRKKKRKGSPIVDGQIKVPALFQDFMFLFDILVSSGSNGS